MAVGDAIRQRMKALHMTQKELANRTGISQATLSNIVTGASESTAETLQALSSVLGVSLADLSRDEEWKYWAEDFPCPRCNSRAVSEFYSHSDGSVRLACAFCGLDTGEQKSRASALRLFASYRQSQKSGAETLAVNAVHVYTVAELVDYSAFDADDVRPVWFENRGLFCVPALLQYGIAERERDCVRVEWHGSYGAKSFEIRAYGDWWRCWSGKPSPVLSDATPWK